MAFLKPRRFLQQRRSFPRLDAVAVVLLLSCGQVLSLEPPAGDDSGLADSPPPETVTPTQAEPTVSRQIGDALWNEAKRYASDTAALVVAPFHWGADDGWRAAGSAALISGAFAADHAVYEAFARNRSDFTDSVSKATTWFGAGGGVAVAFGILGAGLLTGSTEVRDMGRDAVETSLIAGAFTNLVIKPTAGRWRPSESDGVTRFDPFSGHLSFTSGHATQAFAVASVVAMRSPGWVIPTIAYGLATVVACDRINDRAHFASDVVAGALFATSTGRFLVKRHRPISVQESAQPKTRVELVPIRDGVALRASW